MCENDVHLNQIDLLNALSKMFGKTVDKASSKLECLQGGTVAKVFLVSGIASFESNQSTEYKIILKIQQFWERPNDVHSWRREYDLYQSQLDRKLGDMLHIPKCYLALMKDQETELWLEYIKGYSGNQLTVEMLTKVAYQLGRVQGHHIKNLDYFKSLMSYMTDVTFLENELTQWYPNRYSYLFLCSEECSLPNHVKNMLRRNDWDDGFSIIYHYLRSEACDLPLHIKQMVIDIDCQKNAIIKHLSEYPLVLNHRDFWIENLIYHDFNITVIDWDCVGIGYIGEDLASLIGDDTLTDQLVIYFDYLIPAYQKGLSEYIDVNFDPKLIFDMILMKYGYRWIQNHMFSNASKDKQEVEKRFQVLYEIRQNIHRF